MKYAILIYGNEADLDLACSADPDQAVAGWINYTRELGEAGVLRGGEELKPVATATCVRVQGGKVINTDGPFAETKEQLGGFYVIEVANLDEALAWAAKCPGANAGTLEVRPIVER